MYVFQTEERDVHVHHMYNVSVYVRMCAACVSFRVLSVAGANDVTSVEVSRRCRTDAMREHDSVCEKKRRERQKRELNV